MIKSNGTNANTVDVIDANIEKIASIESKRKAQNIDLKDRVSSISESIVDEVRDDSKQIQKTIKENSGLLNSVKRFLGEIKEFLSRTTKQAETQNNLVLSGNGVKSMNNQLVEISMLSRDKNSESIEEFGDSVLNKVSCERQDAIAIENKDNADKISR